MLHLIGIAMLCVGTAFGQAEPAPSGSGSSPAVVATPDYRLGEGDMLTIRVYGESDVSGEYAVASDGTVNFPYLGAVTVAGKTAHQVETEFTASLSDGYYVAPQLNVVVSAFGSRKVEIYGAVKKSGAYYLTGPTYLREMLARAGWVDRERSTRQVLVRHKDETSHVVSIDDLMSSGEGNVELQPGDMISVQEGEVVYVAGEVSKPGAIMFADGLTVTQALTRAGGPTDFAQLRGAYILRGGEKISINLRRVQNGRDADLSMKPGDQLFLKESPF